MSAAKIAVVLVNLIGVDVGQRMAMATEPPPESASLDSQPRQKAPRLTTIDPGPLRCECAPVADSEWHWTERRKAGFAVVGFGVLAGAVGLGFAWSAHRVEVEEAGRSTPGTLASSLNRQIHERDFVAGTLLGVAGLSVLTGAALVLWPESKHVSVTVLPNGGALVACRGAI